MGWHTFSIKTLCQSEVFCYNYSTLPLSHIENYKWYVNKWVWLCSNKLYKNGIEDCNKDEIIKDKFKIIMLLVNSILFIEEYWIDIIFE